MEYSNWVLCFCILLTFAFSSNAFKSLQQNFGHIRTGSKLGILDLAMAKVEKVNIAVTYNQ